MHFNSFCYKWKLIKVYKNVLNISLFNFRNQGIMDGNECSTDQCWNNMLIHFISERIKYKIV